MKKILITGGPVHAYLDDVKIITNKFKGGRIAQLTDEIYMRNMFDKNRGKGYDLKIFYLTTKDSTLPYYATGKTDDGDYVSNGVTILFHNGIDDYMKQVLKLTPEMDSVILGAAVANLVPKNRIKGKFPSHNYKPGDIIPIDFTIAPRIIDEVKKINSKTNLFGFKLLSDSSEEELIDAAYEVLLESKAVTIFANNAKNLENICAITKERGQHYMDRKNIAKWILDRMAENYYETIIGKTNDKNETMKIAEEALKIIIQENKNSFIKVKEGYVFGSVALRFGDPAAWAFVTTSRGKNEIEDFAFVDTVKHDTNTVFCMTTKKASLNAPLFHNIFRTFNNVCSIQHYHCLRYDLTTQEYSTPGTDVDSDRFKYQNHPSFNIKGHGCILSFDKKGNLLK